MGGVSLVCFFLALRWKATLIPALRMSSETHPNR